MCATFRTELDELTTDLARMARRAAWMMINSSLALHRTDLTLAGLVIADGDQMNAMHDDMERLCITLLALQTPVAGDQRFSDHAVAVVSRVCYLTTGRKHGTVLTKSRVGLRVLLPYPCAMRRVADIATSAHWSGPVCAVAAVGHRDRDRRVIW